MGSDSAAAPPASSAPPPRERGYGSLLAGRGRKIVASILVAFVGGVGIAVFAWAKSAGESAANKVLAGSQAVPLQVRVAQPGTFFTGSVIDDYYVFRQGPLSSPARAVEAGWSKAWATSNDILDYHWVKTHGGIAGSPEVVLLELRGKSDEPVIVTAISPEIIRREPPVRGWYIAAPACGAEMVWTADINFDTARPRVAYWRADGKGAAKHLALTVSRTDPVQIELHASTRQAMVEWRAKVFFSGPSGDGSITVDDQGKPFQVSTETESKGYSLGAYNPNHHTVVRMHDWDKYGITAC